MLSNYEIETICKQSNIILDDCCMKDKLNKNKLQPNANYIINLESSSQGNGTHWTALIKRNNIYIYFDSFGVECPTNIINFIKKNPNANLAYNLKEIQNINSHLCGWFCIALLHFVKNKNDIYNAVDTFCNMFNDEGLNNDDILVNYIKSFYPKIINDLKFYIPK
jgi:hypothetical protein